MDKLDCKSFVELIQLIIDDEATQEQKELFKKHYLKCGHCADHYQVESSTIEFLKKKICGCQQNAPTGLVDQIRQKISSLS